MATKIRLQRHGRKGYAFYHIVIADSRAPRDGKFIERIGSYNPNTNPATIDLKFDRALYWLQVGAQPTDTTRTILSTQGVLLKKHLLGGVAKGAFSEAEAETRFQAWIDAKQSALNTLKVKDSDAARAKVKAGLEAEKAVNKVRAAKLAEKRAEKAAAEAITQAEAAASEAAEAAEILEAVEVVETVKAAEAVEAAEAAVEAVKAAEAVVEAAEAAVTETAAPVAEATETAADTDTPAPAAE
ncbi:MAG: 30S ribosomal protein S16 [Dysgonamonadaceae bacterium]|jgi:small subunit ribosomal protein S16|nr:30S ribosomal protein S16 [Dysgonamonadaceae bacterium]